MRKLNFILIITIALFVNVSYAVVYHWTETTNPSPITNEYVLDAADELIVDAGLTIEFTNTGSLTLNGKFKFNGTSSDKIYLTNGSLQSGAYWKGVFIESIGDPNDKNLLEYVVIERVNYQGAMQVENSSNLIISNCEIRNNSCNWLYYQTTDFVDCSGISFLNSNDIKVGNSKFYNNNINGYELVNGSDKYLCLYIYDTVDIDVYNNEFFNNSGVAKALISNISTLNLDSNNVTYFRYNNIHNNYISKNGGYGALYIKDQNQGDSSADPIIRVQYNSICDNASSDPETIFINGGGIFVENLQRSIIEIRNNNISGNTAQYGGGVYLTGKGDNKIIFNNNEVIGNTSFRGSALYYLSSSVDDITNCVFSDNNATGEGTEGSSCGAVYATNWQGDKTIKFENCLFSNNNAVFCGGLYGQYINFVIDNCTFKNNSHSESYSYGKVIGIYSGYQPSGAIYSKFVLNDCVIWNDTNLWNNPSINESLFSHEVVENMPDPPAYLFAKSSINSCIVDNTNFIEKEIIVWNKVYGQTNPEVHTDISSYWIENVNNNLYGNNPLLSNNSDPNDDVYPNIRIASNSPALNFMNQGFDIGRTHPVTETVLNWSKYYAANKIYWVSFPKLDRFGNNKIESRSFLYPYREQLNVITTNDTMTTADGLVNVTKQLQWNTISDDWLTGSTLDSLQSSVGYKISFEEPVTITDTGFKLYDNFVQHLYPGVENWVGYWKEGKTSIKEAMGWLLDDGTPIKSIKHRDWYVSTNPNTQMQSGDPEKLTIEYGDMVIIETYEETELRWNNGEDKPDYVYPQSVYFTYEDEADYIPVFIEKTVRDEPLEYAVFADGICLGASPVMGDITEVHAYIPEDFEETELEIQVIYGRSAENKSVSYTAIDGSDRVVLSKNDDYIHIRTENSEENVPSWDTFSSSNYPNPFNPETTIAFNLPEEGKVSVKIFNIKGQLVRTLANGKMSAGRQEIIWDGKDSAKKGVATGIYFYKINTDKKDLIKKIMLLK